MHQSLKISERLSKFILIFALFFFTRGTIVGDESKVYLFVIEFIGSKQNIFEYLNSVSGTCNLYDKCNYNYLGHHLFWFFYHLSILKLFGFLNMIYFVDLNITIIHEFILSITSTFLIIASINILIKSFKEVKNNWIYIYSFFVGSYGIGFINGGFSECLIIFLISLKIYLKNKNIKGSEFFLSFIDLYIFFLKPYLLVFILLFNLTYKFKKKQIYKYLISFIIFGIIFFLIKFSLKIDYVDYYNEGLDINLINIFERTFFFLFSPSVGIFLTCPFLIVSMINLQNNKLIKIIVVLFYAIFFSFYGDLAFWGGSGIGGSRYIFPIFLIFLEDYLFFLNKIKIKFKIIYLLFSFISFFPSLDYKNTNFALVPEQTGIITLKSVSEYPLGDFNLNPIYFSWNIFLQKDLLNKKEIHFKINEKKFIANNFDIMPDTLISKLSHVSNKNFEKSKILISHHSEKKEIIQNLNNYVIFFEIFRFFIFFIYTSSFICFISTKLKS